MPDILTNCPVTAKPIQTALDTETVKFETLPRMHAAAYEKASLSWKMARRLEVRRSSQNPRTTFVLALAILMVD
jgi:hypothetical protein